MDRKCRNKQERKKSLAVSVVVWLYTDLLQALKGERVSSVFSTDGTLISVSAAPHCGLQQQNHKTILEIVHEKHPATLAAKYAQGLNAYFRRGSLNVCGTPKNKAIGRLVLRCVLV